MKPGRKIYIAAAFGQREHARDLADSIHRNGEGHVVSTWHDSTATSDPTDPAERKVIAEQCLKEVRECDSLWIFTGGRPRGAFFEAGYAHALGKPVYWLSTTDNNPVFDALP